MIMTHLDLFSGIGGFAYAADQVFGEVEHIFIEYDSFCQQVLKKHWPEAPIYGNIKTFNSDTFNEGLERFEQSKRARHARQSSGAGPHETPRPYILTGGFPCQPFSAAGLRRGTADDRHLWPEMLRVIQLTQPEWVIAENVGGILTWNDGLVFEQVCLDLEATGYTVQPFVIPAVAVNAPHRRDRVWFVAHAERGTDRGTPREDGSQAQEERLQERNPIRELEQSDTLQAWNRNWLEVAAELCSVDDGLPARVGRLELTKPQHRKEQLKAYGNAIVPQVAMEIMRAIKDTG